MARSRGRRLLWLLGVLAAAVLLFTLLRGWRERLLSESAAYRATIAATESRVAEERRRQGEQAELESRVTAAPSDPNARLALAQLRWQRQGPAAALPVLQSAPRPFADPRLARMLAHCARLAAREDLALGALNEGIRRFPRDGELYADRALLHVLLAWQAEAEHDLAAAGRFGAGGVHLARASLARAKNDLAGARAILLAAQQDRPDDPEIVRQLAALAMDGRQYAEATRLLAALPASQATPADHLSLAAAHLEQGEVGRARELIDAVLAAQPAQPRARYLRARCLRAADEPDAALRELERLRREQPRMFGIAFELGQLYRQQGRGAEGARLLEEHRAVHAHRGLLRRAAEAIIRRPRDARAHLLVGRLCLERGLIGRAIVEIERARELDPRLSETASLLARARAGVTADAGEES